MGVVASAHGRIEVDPDVLINAGQRVESLGTQLATLCDSLGTALASGIASGADTAGLSFALGYGRQAQDFANTLAAGANSFKSVGYMLQATGYNYKNADAGSTIGGPGPTGSLGPEPSQTVAADMPAGPNGVMVPPPPMWYLVEPLLQALPGLGLIAGAAMAWPSGHAALMNVVAAQWRNFATAFAIFQSELNALKPAVAAQNIPEGAKIGEAFDALGNAMSTMTTTASDMAKHITDFAQEVQQVQNAIRRLLDRLSLSGLWDTVTDFFTGDGMKVLREVARDVGTVLGNFQRQVKGIIGLLDELKNLISDAADAFEKWIRPVLVAQFGDGVGNFLADAVTLYTDFEVGIANGLINTVSGVVSMADPEMWEGLAKTAWAVANNPETAPGVLAEMGKQFIALDQWKGDHPGRGAGEAAFNIGSLFVPGGALSKTGSVAKGLNMTRRVLEEGRLPKLGEIGQWSRGAPRVEGLDNLPGGQGIPDIPEVRPGAVPDALVGGPPGPHSIETPPTPRGFEGPSGPPDPPGPQGTPGPAHEGAGSGDVPPPEPPGRSVPPADAGPGRTDGPVSTPEGSAPPAHTPESPSPTGTHDAPPPPASAPHAPESSSHPPQYDSRPVEHQGGPSVGETHTPAGHDAPAPGHAPPEHHGGGLAEHQPAASQPSAHEPAGQHQPETHDSVGTPPDRDAGQHAVTQTPVVAGGMPMAPHAGGGMHGAADAPSRTPGADPAARAPESRTPQGSSPESPRAQSPAGAGPSTERSPSAPVKPTGTPSLSEATGELARRPPESGASRPDDSPPSPSSREPAAAGDRADQQPDPSGSGHDPGAGDGPGHHPDPTGPAGNPADARIYGPHHLDHVEDPAHQSAVENALRDAKGDYLQHADPRTNDYGNLINDGGPEMRGRSNNCLDCSLSALSSFHGDPTVSAPRFPDRLPDGSIDRESGERNGLNRAQNWLGSGLVEFGGHKLVDQFDLLHQHIDNLGPGSAALVVNGWHARDLITGDYLFDSHDKPITSGSHATVIVHPEGGGGPVWWDPQQGLTSDRPPAWMVDKSTYLHFTPIEPHQGVHHGGTGDQGPSAGVSGAHVSQPDLSHPADSTRVAGDESAVAGTDGSGPISGAGATGDRFRDGDDLSVPELVRDDGGGGLHDVQGDRVQPGREPDLPVSVTHHDATDPGGRANSHVSDDGGVVDRSIRTGSAEPIDHREADIGSRAGGRTDERGDVSRGVAEPAEQRSVAGESHDRGVGGDRADRSVDPKDSHDAPGEPHTANTHGHDDVQHSDGTHEVQDGTAPAERFVELADGTQHRVWASNDQLRELDSRFVAADAWLAERGLTRADIQPLLVQPADWLNSAQRDLVYGFRHQFPDVERGEALQKVIDTGQADGRLAGGSLRFPPNETGGSVSVARDTHGLDSPERIYDGLALEYHNTPFAPDKPAIAMRFEVDEGVPVHLPDEQLSKLTGHGGSFDPGYDYPFTGTGFTASDHLTVPEYFLEGRTAMNPGAEMYRINVDGSEDLIAVLGSDKKWIQVVHDE